MSGVTLQPGQAVDGYTVGAQQREAGLERVYAATSADGTTVALKVPRFDSAGDAELRRRFARQAETAQRVIGPHVVAVLGSGVLADGAPYVVEESLPGGTLADLVTRGPLDIHTALRIGGDAASGLDTLHAQQIVHRSLTPACIWLDADGRAKVGGFALAKVRDATQLTQAGHTVGAAQYIAPEQIRGEQVTPATDVYALGCVLFEALCGAPPFADRQGMKALWAHMQDEPPDLRARRPEVPPDVAWAVSRALSKKPEDRPASATTLMRLAQIAWEGSRPRAGQTG